MEKRDTHEESNMACAPGPPHTVLFFTALFPFCDGVGPTWFNVLIQGYPGSRRD